MGEVKTNVVTLDWDAEIRVIVLNKTYFTDIEILLTVFFRKSKTYESYTHRKPEDEPKQRITFTFKTVLSLHRLGFKGRNFIYPKLRVHHLTPLYRKPLSIRKGNRLSKANLAQ